MATITMSGEENPITVIHLLDADTGIADAGTGTVIENGLPLGGGNEGSVVAIIDMTDAGTDIVIEIVLPSGGDNEGSVVTITGTPVLAEFWHASGGDSIARVLLYDVIQMITHGDRYDTPNRADYEALQYKHVHLFNQAAEKLGVPEVAYDQIKVIVDQERQLLEDKNFFWETEYDPPPADDTTEPTATGDTAEPLATTHPPTTWVATGHMTTDGQLLIGAHQQLYALQGVDTLDIEANSHYVLALMTLASEVQGDIPNGQMAWLYERAIMSAVPIDIINKQYMEFDHENATLEDHTLLSGGSSISRVLLYDLMQMIIAGDQYDHGDRRDDALQQLHYSEMFNKAAEILKIETDYTTLEIETDYTTIEEIVSKENNLFIEKQTLFWETTPYVPPKEIDTTTEEIWTCNGGHLTEDGRLIAGGHNQLYGLKIDYLDIEANSNYVYALMTLVSELQDGIIPKGQMDWLYERAIMSAVPRDIIQEYTSFEHNPATVGHVLTAKIDDEIDSSLHNTTYQWLRESDDIDGAIGPTYTLTDIDGAIGPTYTLTETDVGSKIRVIMSYTDGEESVISAPTNFVTHAILHCSLSGDINGDDMVNVIDVVALVNFILNNDASTPPQCADINVDDNINVLDIVRLINNILDEDTDCDGTGISIFG